MKTVAGFKTEIKGFTLIELLIALAILIVAAATFVPALSFVAKSNSANKVKMTASSIAASIVEEIRAMPYESIGTEGGNPSGAIPKIRSITVGGIKYEVETRIYWSSAKSSISGAENVVAMKNIQVIVRAPGAFSGTVEIIDEIHSTASRESEEVISKNGHIRVAVKDSANMPFNSVATAVNLVGGTPPVNQHMTTDGSGQVLFGNLAAGKYTVRVKMPEGFSAGPGQTVEDGWIVVRGVEVINYQTTDVMVYMDEKEKFCRLSVILVNADDTAGAAIITGGRITLNWQSESLNINVVDNREFTADDFVEGELPHGFFGPLWSRGTYSLAITGVPGYAGYDMSLDSSGKPLLPDGTEWDGTMPGPGQSLELRIPLRKGESGYFYREDTKEDFKNAALIENLAVTDENGGMLVLGESRTETNLVSLPDLLNKLEASSWDSDHPVQDICDGNDDTYWQEGRRSKDSWVKWDFGINGTVKRVEILAKVWRDGNWPDDWSRVPKNFKFQCSSDGVNWSDLLPDGTLANYSGSYQVFNINNPKTARHFRLLITSRYDRRVAVNEVRLIGTAGYAGTGRRISRGIPLDRPEFATAPGFKISWQAETGDNTGIRIYTAVTSDGQMPDESEFDEVGNGGYIPGIARGSDIRGKYLWVMEEFETGDIKRTPSLDWLSIYY